MSNLSLVFDIVAKDKASREFKNVGNAAEGAGKKGGKFGGAMAAGAAVAGAAVVGFAASSVRAFVDAEQSSVRLDEALKKFPATNDRSRESFDKLNASLSKKTKFDDDATASGQAVLAQFKLTGEQIQDLTPLLQDYAAKTGKDLPTAAQDLGKAINGQGRALKNIGINFKDTGDATGNYEQLMGGLRKQVGGFATAEGKTAAGQAEILRNQFGELQESVGQKLVPVLTRLATELLKVIDFVQRNQAVIVPLVTVLGTFAAVVFTITKAAKAYTAVQAALNIVLAANPIGLVVIAVAALAAGLVLAYKRSETFRDIVKGAFASVLGAVDKLLGGVQTMLRVLGKVPGFGWAKDAARSNGGARDAVRGLAREIQGLPAYKRVTVDYQQVASITSVPYSKRAGGGPVSKGMPYLVGEREPELFVPRVSGQIYNQQQLARMGQSSGGGLSIGAINVTSGPGENAAQSVPRTLRNLAFTMGV